MTLGFILQDFMVPVGHFSIFSGLGATWRGLGLQGPVSEPNERRKNMSWASIFMCFFNFGGSVFQVDFRKASGLIC